MIAKKYSRSLIGFIYVFGSQIIVLLSGIVKALLLPALLDLSDYGTWQVYCFYVLYLGIFTFGYGDGLYLKYGGHEIDGLPLLRLRSANRFYLSISLFFSIFFFLLSLVYTSSETQFLLMALAANVIVFGVTAVISLTLQATNKLKDYAFLNSADKVFFSLSLLALLDIEFRNFRYLIISDLISKIVVAGFLFFRFRRFFFGEHTGFRDGMREFVDSVAVGSNLLLANLAGMLFLGIGRMVVEYFGVISEYAYYALAMSLASIALMSISALSVVIYPTLMRRRADEHINDFEYASRLFDFFGILVLTLYFPLMLYIEVSAPGYLPVVQILNAMFVVTVLQGKMQLVNNTYYKVLRLEREIMTANLRSLVFVALVTFVSFAMTKSMLAIVYSAVVTMFYRVYSADAFLRRQMGQEYKLTLGIDFVSLILFLIVTSFLSFAAAFSLWILSLIVFLLIKRRELCSLVGRFYSSSFL